jgi:anti-anti-sigma factor
MPVKISTTAAAGTATVVVVGEIDVVSAPELARTLDAAPAGDHLVVDLTAVTFLDSAGVRALYDQVDRQPELIVAPGAIILRILTLTGLCDVLTVREF